MSEQDDSESETELIESDYQESKEEPVGYEPEKTSDDSSFNFVDDFLANFVVLVLIAGTGAAVFVLDVLPDLHGPIFISLAILFSSVLMAPFIDIKQI